MYAHPEDDKPVTVFSTQGNLLLSINKSGLIFLVSGTRSTVSKWPMSSSISI
ncbi:hypothetical protein SynTAK9802_00981 [Synechococcus sp. TAK9802]|nr:hypothetical protein SynTAK9802_00981 [Synechococcus sp. TAK9802]